MPASLPTSRASVTVFTAEDASVWADLTTAVPAEIADRMAWYGSSAYRAAVLVGPGSERSDR